MGLSNRTLFSFYQYLIHFPQFNFIIFDTDFDFDFMEATQKMFPGAKIQVEAEMPHGGPAKDYFAEDTWKVLTTKGGFERAKTTYSARRDAPRGMKGVQEAAMDPAYFVTIK